MTQQLEAPTGSRTKTVTNVAIYCRISSDDAKLGRGVQRQLEDARHLCEARGWVVVAEFTDNDLSAWTGVDRPGYQALLGLLEFGAIDQIVVLHQSRLWRNRRERAAGIELLQRLRVGLVPINGVPLDFSSSSGRFLGDLLGALDTSESETKSERLLDEARHRAAQGRPHGRAPFGWVRIYEMHGGRLVSLGDVENPEEADVVREIVRRLLAGDALSGIAKDLTKRGLHSPGWLARRKDNDGNVPAEASDRWHALSVRQIAMRETNVGKRTHNGEFTAEATWPAIVDQDSHDRVVALLTDPARHRARDGKRRWLLTNGIGRCSQCGDVLGARNKAGHVAYRCQSKGCVYRRVSWVDELVDQWMVARLGQPDAAAAFDRDDALAQEARARADALKAKLAVAADQYADDVISSEQLARISQKLRPELQAAEGDVQRNRAPTLPDGVDGLLATSAAERAATWAAMPLAAKRSILTALRVEVVIHPMGRSGPGSFNPQEIEFRYS